MLPARTIIENVGDAAADSVVNQTIDFHVSASIGNEKLDISELEARWSEIPDRYLIIIAQLIAGTSNNTEFVERLNEPILKSSIKSVFWIFLIQYGLLAILGIIMNLAIISYITYHHLYKDVTHAFIINLALCHFVQCAIALPITLIVMLIQNWIFGQFLCFFLPMLQDIPLHVAMITHILIAWDRMRWLNDPLQGRLPAFVCCCATWLTGMVIALPYPIYTIYVEIGDYVPRLDGIGLCVVNLMDDMHEYARGLFLIMYCGPTVLLAYLYIRTSQEFCPPDGHFPVMMFEHRNELRNSQRNASTSSVEQTLNNGAATTFGVGPSITSTSSNAASNLPVPTHKASRSYDLYSAELDVYREKRKQRHFGSMATAQVVCLCPLMILRLARLSMEETYENTKHFDFTFLMFVWIAFLPTVIFPCIYASQILPRTEQERLRGYFKLSTKRLHRAGKTGGCRGTDGQQASSSREDSIEKDDNTNTTQATASYANGGSDCGTIKSGRDADGGVDVSISVRKGMHSKQTGKSQCGDSVSVAYRQRKHRHGVCEKLGGYDASKRKDQETSTRSEDINMAMRHSKGVGSIQKGDSRQSSFKGSDMQRRSNKSSFDNNSCSNITSSTYCNGNTIGTNSRLDDADYSNFGDGEDSSIVSGMVIHNSRNSGTLSTVLYDGKWSTHSDQPLQAAEQTFSECSSLGHMDSSSTLDRDLEILDLLERKRSMDSNEVTHFRLTNERRRLPDIEKIMQRSPKANLEPYKFGALKASSSTAEGTDPLQPSVTHDFSSAVIVPNDKLTNLKVPDDEEVPQDFYDNFSPGGAVNLPPTVPSTPLATTSPYQYQYSRRSSRKQAHHQPSTFSSHSRIHKRDSMGSLRGSDLIASPFAALDPDPMQPLNKMTQVDDQMRRSSGRNSSFSSSGRSSLRLRDHNLGSSIAPNPELDLRENIFAEL